MKPNVKTVQKFKMKLITGAVKMITNCNLSAIQAQFANQNKIKTKVYERLQILT